MTIEEEIQNKAEESEVVEQSAELEGDQSEKEESDTSTAQEGENPAGEAETDDQKNGVQKRISELTRKRKEAEAEAEYWRKRAEESNKRESVTTEEPEPPELPDPELKFSHPEKYQEAMKQYKADVKAFSQQMWAYQSQQGQAQASKVQQEVESAKVDAVWKAQVESAKEEFKDFDSVALNPNLPVSEAMAEVIRESDIGAALLYELGKKPDVALNIANMSPVKAARELGKLEARLQVAPKKESKAPAPVKTVSGKGESAGLPDDQMDIDEWMARERKRVEARYG